MVWRYIRSARYGRDEALESSGRFKEMSWEWRFKIRSGMREQASGFGYVDLHPVVSSSWEIYTGGIKGPPGDVRRRRRDFG